MLSRPERPSRRHPAFSHRWFAQQISPGAGSLRGVQTPPPARRTLRSICSRVGRYTCFKPGSVPSARPHSTAFLLRVWGAAASRDPCRSEEPGVQAARTQLLPPAGSGHVPAPRGRTRRLSLQAGDPDGPRRGHLFEVPQPVGSSPGTPGPDMGPLGHPACPDHVWSPTPSSWQRS